MEERHDQTQAESCFSIAFATFQISWVGSRPLKFSRRTLVDGRGGGRSEKSRLSICL